MRISQNSEREKRINDLNLRFRLSAEEERRNDPERNKLSYKISIDLNEERIVAAIMRKIANMLETKKFSTINGIDWSGINKYLQRYLYGREI